MKCPDCDNTNTRVLSTRQDGQVVQRARKCDACGRRWTTTELERGWLDRLLRTESLAQKLAQEVTRG